MVLRHCDLERGEGASCLRNGVGVRLKPRGARGGGSPISRDLSQNGYSLSLSPSPSPSPSPSLSLSLSLSLSRTYTRRLSHLSLATEHSDHNFKRHFMGGKKSRMRILAASFQAVSSFFLGRAADLRCGFALEIVTFVLAHHILRVETHLALECIFNTAGALPHQGHSLVHSQCPQGTEDELQHSIDAAAAKVNNEARNDRSHKSADVHAHDVSHAIGFDTVACAWCSSSASPTLPNAIGNTSSAIDDGIGKEQTAGAKLAKQQKDAKETGQGSRDEDHGFARQFSRKQKRGTCRKDQGGRGDHHESYAAELCCPSVGHLEQHDGGDLDRGN